MVGPDDANISASFYSICMVQVYENSTIVFGCGGLSLNIAAHRIRGVGGRERGWEDSGKERASRTCTTV